MDKAEPRKDLTEEMTRESLIAISYGVPDDDLPADSPKNIDNNKVVEPLTHDGDEKYRSKLISISYSPSPDMEVLPQLPGGLDG